MSADDYYNRNPLPSRQPASSPAPYYSAYNQQASSTYSTPPPYSSQPYLGSGANQHNQQQRADASAVSPFDTPFDDNVYNVSSHQSGASSQQHLTQQETGYFGLGRTPSADNMASNDNIPLRDRTPKPLADDANDHVYDAPQRRRSRKAGVRFGELGMFGANSKRIPFVVYAFSLVQIGVFIGEIVKNATLTGSPIMIHPSFNPMIGPSPYVLINMGSRFVPCMHNIAAIQGSTIEISWPCPNTTTSDSTSASQHCTLSDLCGFGGVPEPKYDGNEDQSPQPNQWFRFIVPMFMHAGLIHIGFNLLLQLTMGREMEKAIGPIRFFLVYVSAGIFGFVMGGNFAGEAISSTGASGSLFGVIALTLLDLLYSWKDRRSPVKDLMFILLDVIISFVLGLLPGLDNFSHIGGFLMGLALGICVLHSPNSLRRRIGEDVPYSSVNAGLPSSDPPSFFRNPVGFFKGRKPLWWAWWLLRAGALVAVLVVFIVLLNNFYVYHKTCGWCKYLSCLPINNWCDNGLTFTNSSTKRDVLQSWEHVAKLYTA